jgi:hypothetical protein|tara:strand:- start:408 stop:920 length:513 start_codon:yes stop_codon:yes gene_type:complete
MKSNNIVTNVNKLYQAESFMTTLVDFERVLDSVHLYAYENWLKGELVEGPKVDKHWVTCTFMWPHKMMPEPQGAKRLLDYNIKVRYKKDILESPVTIKSPDDMAPGGRYPKMKSDPIWLVEIRMPRTIMSDIYRGTMELEGEKIDLDDINTAYQQDLDFDGTTDDNTEAE